VFFRYSIAEILLAPADAVAVQSVRTWSRDSADRA
jgi:hypothetical protein